MHTETKLGTIISRLHWFCFWRVCICLWDGQYLVPPPTGTITTQNIWTLSVWSEHGHPGSPLDYHHGAPKKFWTLSFLVGLLEFGDLGDPSPDHHQLGFGSLDHHTQNFDLVVLGWASRMELSDFPLDYHHPKMFGLRHFGLGFQNWGGQMHIWGRTMAQAQAADDLLESLVR